LNFIGIFFMLCPFFLQGGGNPPGSRLPGIVNPGAESLHAAEGGMSRTEIAFSDRRSYRLKTRFSSGT
jgi:hypothetical protein